MLILSLSVRSVIVDAILGIGEGLKKFLSWIINLLPNDPFNLSDVLTVPDSVRRVLSFVNWLVPIGRCLQLIFVWFAIIATIWFVRFLLKVSHVI